jgi:hypothetical protein
MKKSIILLLVVLVVIGVAAIGIAASKKGQGGDDQGQDNNDQGCDRKHPCDDGNPCTTDTCNRDGECVSVPSADYTPCTGGTCCSGECTFLEGDSENCGQCGRSCSSLQHCESGVCTCNPDNLCHGNCIDPSEWYCCNDVPCEDDCPYNGYCNDPNE